MACTMQLSPHDKPACPAVEKAATMKAAHLVDTEMNGCPQLRLPKSAEPLGPSDAASSCTCLLPRERK